MVGALVFSVIVKTSRRFVAYYLHSPAQVTASSDYVDVDDNQFTCNCLKVGWLLALATTGLNSRALGSEKQGDGTVTFLQQLVARAGPCLECAGAECRDAADSVTLAQFAAAALETDPATAGGAVRCAGSGLVIRNYDDTAAAGAGAGAGEQLPANLRRQSEVTAASSEASSSSSVAETVRSEEGRGAAGRDRDGHERIVNLSDANSHFVNIVLFSIPLFVTAFSSC